MIKFFIIVVILAGLFVVGRELNTKYKKAKVESGEIDKSPVQPVTPGVDLPGLDPMYEGSLGNAKRQGPKALGKWLDQNRHAVRDPRLADIELDYVVLVSRQDPSEAKRIFKNVKARTPATSPVYARIKKLEGTYQ